MSDKKSAIHGLNIRVWAVEGGVDPLTEPIFMALAKINDPSQSSGDATRIPAPDPDNFNRDITMGSVPGTKERGTLTISKRYTVIQDRLIQWARQECRTDLFGLVGKCGNPQDFEKGGEKWVYFPDCRPSTISMENFSAFGLDETNPTNSNLDMTFREFWEFLKMNTAQIHAATTTREIMAVAVCDHRSCGDCDRESMGCDRVFAIMAGVSATPGTQPLLIYSDDGGVTVATQTIDTLFSNERVAGAICIGGDLVLISTEGNEIHYTNVDDIFIGQNDWLENDNGFVIGGEPLAIWSSGPNHTWIVGNGGYIYFSRNHRASVTVQDPGATVTQNLLCVHACDKNNVLVVGENNTVLISRNGGDIWDTRTGPAVGEFLSVCWMLDPDTWIVGTGAGGSGVLYVTDDGGYTWSEIELPVTNIGQFDRLVFSSEAEGFLSYRTGGSAGMLRTITGGNIWWALPDNQKDNLPDTDYILDIAVCESDSNTFFAGGLDGDGSTGMFMKGEGPLAD